MVALLKQIKGVGTLIAMALLLTLEDPHRFGKSRDVGCPSPGLQQGRRTPGRSEPQLHTTSAKKAIPICERAVGCKEAQHILGPFGVDCDLTALGPEAEVRTGRKKREEASHRGDLKAGGVVASPVGERRSIRTAAQQQPESDAGGSIESKSTA